MRRSRHETLIVIGVNECIGDLALLAVDMV
jgi:hypothetical protein